MAPSARRLGWIVAGGLAGASFALAVHYGSLREHLPYQGYLLLALGITLCILGSLAYVAWRVEPAWLLTGALLASAFNGNWGALGFPPGVALDRMLLIAAIAALIARSPGARDLPRLRFQPVHGLLLLTLAWVIGSAIAAGTVGNSATIFVLFDRFAVPFAVFALAPIAFHEPRHRAGLLTAMVAFGGYLGLTAVFEGIGAHALVFPGYIVDSSYGYHAARARGPFVEATANGIGLYVSAVAAAVALATWEGRRRKLIAAAVLAACALGLLFTLTRSVWVATVVATILTLAIVPSLRRLLLPSMIGLCALVLLALAIVPGLADSVEDRREANRPVWERENVNAAALNMVSKRPLLGFGLGTFNEKNRDYFRLLDRVPQVAVREIGIHNVFLSLAVEVGLIGAGLFVASLLCSVGGALLSRGPPEMSAWRAGLLAIVLFWVVVANFAPTGQVFPSLVVWFWAGVVLSGAVSVHVVARRPAPIPARRAQLAYESSE
jgi:putative inorganic carbon (hco3(-)) transporter